MMSHSDIVASVQEAWSVAFAQRNVSRLVSLYTPEALFFGSKAELFEGHDGIRRYFTELSPTFKQARFSDATILLLAPEVFAASSSVLFTVEEGGSSRLLPYRMTHILVDRQGAWLIATHHASRVP